MRPACGIGGCASQSAAASPPTMAPLFPQPGSLEEVPGPPLTPPPNRGQINPLEARG